MKMLVAIVLGAVAAVLAEDAPGLLYVRPSLLTFSPRYSAIGFQRQQAAPSPGSSAPYPPSGFRPAGLEFNLLARQQVPQAAAATPQPPTASTPARRFRPASTTTTEVATTIASADETTTEPQSEQIQDDNRVEDGERSGKLGDASGVQAVEQGTYYIYHPDGALQRVAYAAGNDVARMAYIAQLRYQNVEPIRDPIYTYNPDTFVLQQVRL